MAGDLMRREWEEFWKNVGPEGAPAVQIQEFRRAFYAGAYALLCLQLNRLDPGTDPTADDIEMMDGIHDELVHFFATIGEQSEGERQREH